MMRIKTSALMMTVLIVTALLSGATAVFADGETFEVVSIINTGCDDSDFDLNIELTNLENNPGSYHVRTVVTVDGLIYMNEDASIFYNPPNGTHTWSLYTSFTYGSVPNAGTFPMPAGEEMQVDFTLERPVGTILHTWRLVVDGCDTGNILFNGSLSTAGAGCGLSIPEGAVVGDAPLGAQVYYAPGQESPGVVLNPGTYIVTGQDESETYYQVVLACQFVWVRKDTMQPSFQAPQNGAPLPTTIVS